MLLVGGVRLGKNGHVTLGSEQLSLADADQQNLFVAAKYRFSDAWSISAQLAQAGEAGDVADTGARLFGIAAQYDLSKRSNVAAYFTAIRNEAAATYNFSDNGIDQLLAGKDPRVLGLGFNHTF